MRKRKKPTVMGLYSHTLCNEIFLLLFREKERIISKDLYVHCRFQRLFSILRMFRREKAVN